MTTTPVIEATDLHKSYGDVRAVRGIDLSVHPGEVVAVLGPNGAGKTTLIEMLLGMRRPDRGGVRLFGQAPEAAAVKARVGGMLQDVDTPKSLTVAEIIGLVRRYYPRALPVTEVLARADLQAKADARASSLSGGQRQRLSYAMALVGDPDLLFLDEPTAALDIEARRAFWAQLQQLTANGTTILLASHNMAEVQALADRVVVIHRGRVVADGTPSYIAGRVATRGIEVSTDAAADWLRTLPGVVRLRRTEERHDGLERYALTSSDPESTVKALCASGAAVRRLVVADSDMETAFLHLIGDEPAEAEPAIAQEKEPAR